jgi:hypothetical protein
MANTIKKRALQMLMLAISKENELWKLMKSEESPRRLKKSEGRCVMRLHQRLVCIYRPQVLIFVSN